MIKITTLNPGFVRIGDSLYNSQNQLRLFVQEDKVGLSEQQPTGSQWIVFPTVYSQWVDDSDVPFTSVSSLVDYLTLKMNVATEAIAVGLSNIIDANLALSSNPAIVNMNVNGTLLAPQVFEVAMTKPSVITRLSLYLEDNAGFSNDTFGNLPILPNGCILMIGGQPVAQWRTNQDIAMSSDSIVNYTLFANVNNHFLAFRNFRPNLFLLQGQKVQLMVRDNLTGLVNLNIKVQGYRL